MSNILVIVDVQKQFKDFMKQIRVIKTSISKFSRFYTPIK